MLLVNMSQEQVQNETKTASNLKSQKTIPGQNVGISKTLLTPCRRLGLSRKIKVTPSSHNQNSPTATSPLSCSLVITPSLKIQESPAEAISSGKCVKPGGKKKDFQRTRANIQTRFPVEVINKPTNDLTYDATNYSDNLEHKPHIILKGTNRPTNEANDKNKTCKSEKIKKKKEKCEAKRTESPDLFEHTENNSIEIELHTEQTSTSNPAQNTDSVIVQSAEMLKEKPITKNCSTASTSGNASKKSFSKRLSMKKSSSFKDELTDADSLNLSKTSLSSLFDEQFSKECIVEVENIMHASEKSDKQIKLNSDKHHKKRCIVYSSEEDDFVSSQHSMSKKSNSSQDKDDENWYEKIKEMKERIKNKEKHLEELKQAAIYKKLHDIGELKQATKTWKKCCEDGLVYLLPKLQEHGQIDMQTVIKNLNIPKTVTYDVENGCFK